MGKERGQFASNIGFVLAAAGSAVGLGNIWKFPGKAYTGGGGAFLIIYLIIVAVIGTTAMLAEFTVGRNTNKNAVGAVRTINKRWTWTGGLGIVTGFIIMCYYTQVGGWVMKYIFAYLFEPSAVFADPKRYFYTLLGAYGKEACAFPLGGSIIWPLIFMAITVFIIIKGIEGGIEKFNKFAMPALFIILIALMIRSLTLPGAMDGVKYLLNVDFSRITADSIAAALGQAFFSLSLGMGVMVTYGSYLSKSENLIKNTGLICLLDTLVALIAGFAIIPAVFASGVEPGVGGGFAFISLAAVFQGMPGGNLFGILFYVLLLFAALTSAISILEGTVAFITEEKKISRKKATIIIGFLMFAIGIFYTLGQGYLPIKGIWFDLQNGVSYPSFGDFMEYLTDRILMPFGALMFCIFTGYIWKAKTSLAEMSQGGRFRLGFYGKCYPLLLKIVAPLGILTILIYAFVFGTTL